ncbi:MAG: DUF3592 domain-containing protein [Armatimonadota bacterium]|nr:DUF3592 domain-containing protein [Armatimonadota bacterium]MDR7448562.1 DUF3592 domain-containing protein [Armatimonadota bacterium]MDR7458927.1 DUF3592 domain-containing protein [Armatimonadota bacterium]MDR7478926.1 DUF3592 domain-containing protein [Armatimonadota bacterium]MDR7488324.1 DUF3592 domain-containing protein [Armatimonadota bacterium]
MPLAGVGLFLGAALWIVLAEVQADRSRSAEALAEVVEVRKVTWTTQDEESMEVHEGYDITYRYRVAGRVYEGLRTQDETYKPGDAVKVCYNPARPEDHRLRPAGFRCGR